MLRKFVILGYLTATAFLVAHLMNAVIAHRLAGPVEVGKAGAAIEDLAVSKADLRHLARETAASSLFPHVNTNGLTAFEIVTPDSGDPQMGSPLDVAKKVKLMGTVIGDRGKPLAILQDVKLRKQRLYRLHDTIPEVGQISAISRETVVIQRGDQRETLELDILRRQQRTNGKAIYAASVKADSSPLRLVLNRREVAQSLADLPKLLSQARAVPFYTNGKLDGWRMVFIKPKSFYKKLGLRRGDILQRVNGVEIRDPSMMLALFQEVKNERSVRLGLLRNNKRTTLTYEIR